MNSTKTTFGLLLLACALAASLGRPDGVARALTDEIQVYDAEIDKVGQWNLTLHNNFVAVGHREPDFPGGIVPNHSLNGVAEWAYGVREWFELGVYMPLYSLTGDGRLLFNGAKLRGLFVVPHAGERSFFYGVNFELSYNSRHWDQSRYAGEVRMIVGGRTGPVDIIFNPIFDTDFHGIKSLDFAPAERIAYNFAQIWAVALEHYEDYGRLNALAPLDRQDQTLFVVVDYKAEPNSVEFGVGHGFTGGGECLVFKLMLEHDF
jgi:hypothetical protein